MGLRIKGMYFSAQMHHVWCFYILFRIFSNYPVQTTSYYVFDCHCASHIDIQGVIVIERLNMVNKFTYV